MTVPRNPDVLTLVATYGTATAITELEWTATDSEMSACLDALDADAALLFGHPVNCDRIDAYEGEIYRGSFVASQWRR